MPDVNILVYAHRNDTAEHVRYRTWLRDLAEGEEPFALSEPVVQGFLRAVTNSRVFREANVMAAALEFVDELMARPGCRLIRPGETHWRIFRELCERTGVRGPLVADAAHAALAIEHGCEWVTADTDFARFAPTLRWRLI